MNRMAYNTREHAIELHKLGLTRKEIAIEMGADYSNICKHLRKADRGYWGKKRSALMKCRSCHRPHEISVYPALARPYKIPRDRHAPTYSTEVNQKIVLYFTEGLTTQEIAKEMGMSAWSIFDILNQCGVTLNRKRMVYERRKLKVEAL